MNVYLVRHAIAVPRGSPGTLDDRTRDLTPAGIKKMRSNAAALARLKVVIDEIWTSPLTRAARTAEILSEALALAASPRVAKDLAPGGDAQQLVRRLARHSNRTGVALVGHQPDLGVLGTFLLTGSRHAALELKKGGIACIEIDDFSPPLRGRLRWLLTPRQMRLII